MAQPHYGLRVIIVQEVILGIERIKLLWVRKQINLRERKKREKGERRRAWSWSSPLTVD